MLVTAKTSSNHYHLDNLIFTRQYRYKQEIRESVHISFYSRRPHSFTKKYNKINLHYFVDKMKWILFLFTNGLQSNRCVFNCKMKCIITMIDFFCKKNVNSTGLEILMSLYFTVILLSTWKVNLIYQISFSGHLFYDL